MRRGAGVLAKGLAISLAAGTAMAETQAAEPPVATAAAPAPTLYSPDSDPYFAQPYVDIDELPLRLLSHVATPDGVCSDVAAALQPECVFAPELLRSGAI